MVTRHIWKLSSLPKGVQPKKGTIIGAHAAYFSVFFIRITIVYTI